jgi:hypothetical protein
MPPRGPRHARPSGGGRHAAPAPSRQAQRANVAAARQQRAASAAAAGRPVPYGYTAGSPVQVRRPEPVIIEPGKALAGAPRVLIAEFLVCIVVVAAKPFEKAGEDAKLSEGTLGQFAAIMTFFFILALFGGVSARTQKIANLFGALVTLGLIFKNTESIAAVATALQGSVKTPAKPAGNQAQPGPNNVGSAPTATGA